jgi:hypothetical protein
MPPRGWKKRKDQRPAPSRRTRLWPIKLYRTPDGKLHDVCGQCHGSGKQYREVSFSDHPGSSEWTPTGKKCLYCKGTGLDYSPVTVLDHDGKTPPK